MPTPPTEVTFLCGTGKDLEANIKMKLELICEVFCKEDPQNGGFKKASQTTNHSTALILLIVELVHCATCQYESIRQFFSNSFN